MSELGNTKSAFDKCKHESNGMIKGLEEDLELVKENLEKMTNENKTMNKENTENRIEMNKIERNNKEKLNL